MHNLFEQMKEFKPLFEEKECPDLQGISYPDADTVVVYPPTINWDWMRQRPQQIMEQFAKHGFHVYYCNMTQSKERFSTDVAHNLTVIHQNICFVRHVIPALKQQGKKIILWTSWSKLHYFIDLYKPDLVIYDYLDDFSAWRPYLSGMMEKADAVVTTAAQLKKQVQIEFPHMPNYFIPNGCDIEHFKAAEGSVQPPEIEKHSGPVITYCGAWADWIDTELVEKIAAEFKDSLVQIIGAEFNSRVNQTIPNIKYIGYKPYDELPVYLRHSTVCIIPFLINETTIATNPIKLYEYLAAGRPVVSSDLPEVRGVPGVYIGKTHDMFIEKLKKIIDGQTELDWQMVNMWLTEHTWEKRFERVRVMLKEHGV